jgi:hypothetical protein
MTAEPVLTPDRWCDRCGGALVAGGHEGCAVARTLEPPRFCPLCRRRLTVQVLPAGWTATCSEHGTTTPQVRADHEVTDATRRREGT